MAANDEDLDDDDDKDEDGDNVDEAQTGNLKPKKL